MVTRYGMSSEFDMIALETVTNQYLGGDTSLACSSETAARVDEEVNSIIRTAHEKAQQILRDNITKLHELAKFLLEKDNWGRWGFRVGKRRHGMIVDFMTDNDIAGGNSGSPVLNADGDLIGLAFDGNLESLASDTSYTEGYNKCINTDIRFVMWVLEKYAGMKRIIKEIEFS